MAVLGNPQRLLHVTGINVFVGDMIRHVSTIPEQIDKVTETYAKRIERDARATAPVGETGRLRDSIKATRIDSGFWMVEAQAPYSVYVEYGTRYVDPRPFMRPAFDRHVPRFERALVKLMGPVREFGGMP